MQPEIKYIELKSGFSDDGPAWIGLVQFTKSGRTLYFNNHAFQSLGGTGIGANYYDVETGDEYWISGVKKNQQDRHWAGTGVIHVDDRIAEDYKKIINVSQLDSRKYMLVSVDKKVPIDRIHERENEAFPESKSESDRDLSFKQPNELSVDQLKIVIDYLSEQETLVHFNKARRSFKANRKLFEEELESRNRVLN